MHDPSKTKQELIEETSDLKKKIVALMVKDVLNRIILIISILAGLGLVATALFYQKKIGSIVIVLALLATIIVAKLLMQSGRIRLSAIFIISSLWLIFSCFVFLGGGLDNINVIFFLCFVVIAGLLLGERAAILVTAASIIFGCGLALLAIFGCLPSRYFVESPLGNLVQLIFALVLTASALNLALRERNSALNMANKELSDRLEAEDALRESERKYRELVDFLPIAIFECDLKGFVTSANPAIFEMFGYTKSDLEKGLNGFQMIIPDDQERMAKNILALLNKEKDASSEYAAIRKDGGIFPCLFFTSVIVRNDKPIGLRGAIADITSRKHAEAELKKSQETLHLITENMSDMIRVVDLKGNNIYVSPSHFKGLGYRPEERVGKPALDVVHPDDIEMILNKMAEGRISNQATRVEYRVRHADGHYVWLDTVGDLLRDAQGEPIAVVMSSRDISDRKRLEEERQKLEERLHRAEKMESLGQLAGGVAHDLNNVLGVLSGYSELLLMEFPEGQRGRSHVEKILRSTEKGAAIIQDLLTLARRGVMSADVVNLNDIISGFLKTPVFDNIKDYHPGVTFKTAFDYNLLNIKGSPVHLEKVLMNLVSNAAESISGEGIVTIWTESCYLDKAIMGYDEVKEGDYAVLSVSDTGKGIPPESKSKIFDPFYTKKTMGRSGTGLGLSIVWGTVKDHHGYIDVQTEFGAGTTFTLYFPVTRDETTAPQQKIPIEQYMSKGESILVIDDIAEQRDVASGLLKKLGYKVHTVASGEEAVEYIKGNKADLLVLDMIMLPGIDGLETYQRVLEINPKQKAVIVSGFSETDRVRKAQELGAGAYVKKPYVMETIGLTIRNELNR